MNKLVIKKEDLRHNIEKIKEYRDKTGKDDNGNKVRIIAVVKANAYGMGLVEFTKFLRDNGIDFFACATSEEALKLREAGVKEDILMLSSIAIEDEIKALIDNNIIITIGSKEDIKIAEKLGSKMNKTIRAHLKIDTGFGRYGFIYDSRDDLIECLKEIKNIKIEGTFSHFSSSFYDEDYTKKQFDRFMDVIEVLKMNDIETGMLHICNSSAFVKFPNMHLNAVRLGSIFSGRLAFKNTLGLKKIGFLESNVTEIKELSEGFNIGYSNTYKTKSKTKVAIIPCGYMDGINIIVDKDMYRKVDKIRYIVNAIKDLFKKKEMYVNIKEKKCKVLGRIGTYHIVCDITNKDINIGDKVVFDISPKFVDSGLRREYI